jgi:hypothetical protein
MMTGKRGIGLIAMIFMIAVQSSHIVEAQTKKEWEARLLATDKFMREKMWNPANGNFIRRTDQPINSQRSDSWGITIVLDAYSYMIRTGNLKAEALHAYYISSSALYERTNGGAGARIIARQGDQIYVGGDDEMQWAAALVNCFDATKDSTYLNAAMGAFNGLIDLGFWKKATDKTPSGWAWNTNDQRPMGVSTSYGALAAARLFRITGLEVYRQWALVALSALATPQISFIPRDRMIAAEAALTVYQVTHDQKFLDVTLEHAAIALKEIQSIAAGLNQGERNPTDVGDLAEGMLAVSDVAGKKEYFSKAQWLVNLFFQSRTNDDVAENGFYSRYAGKNLAKPDLTGAYIGVPTTAKFLPEIAEMLKLEAEMLLHAR